MIRACPLSPFYSFQKAPKARSVAFCSCRLRGWGVQEHLPSVPVSLGSTRLPLSANTGHSHPLGTALPLLTAPPHPFKTKSGLGLIKLPASYLASMEMQSRFHVARSHRLLGPTCLAGREGPDCGPGRCGPSLGLRSSEAEWAEPSALSQGPLSPAAGCSIPRLIWQKTGLAFGW